MKHLLLAAILLLAVRVSLVGAQVVDTTRVDSLAADTTDYTGLFLKAQQDARKLIPVAPRLGAGALLPLRSRFSFDRDTILWHNAETVSDLLTKVPGVFLLRGGWAGRPELPTFQARGATSVQYVLDGMPYLPIGQDSVMVDPSLLPLSFLDRVEVERSPGQLRVLMFTHRQDRSVPFSRIGIASGDLQIARYQGQLEKRASNGLGFAVAFDHLAVPVQQGETGDYSNTQGWIRLEYVPSARFAAEVQYFQNAPDREAIVCPVIAQTQQAICGATTDTMSRARHGARGDLVGRVFMAGRSDGLGPRLDLLVSRTHWTDEIERDTTRVRIDTLQFEGTVISVDTSYDSRRHTRGITQAGATAAYRWSTASLEASAFYRNTWTPLEIRARGGIAPTRWFTLNADGAYLRHDHSRTSSWVVGRAGIALPLRFAVAGVWRKGTEVALPALADDAAQDLDDRSVILSWRGGIAEFEASYSSNAGYRPAGYAQYPLLVNLGSSERTEWLTFNARLAPRQWLVFDGWYSSPRGLRPEGQPPTHSMLNGTIQSKFLPTFRSGIFNVKLQGSAESWGTGELGRDSTGTAITLKGATHIRAYIGLQIGSFTAYYDRYNAQGTRLPYVPGLSVPRFVSTFGVRWDFSN